MRAGADAADIIISRLRATVVQGTVTSNFGEPLAGATVSANIAGAKETRTDRDGRYTYDVNLPENLQVALVRVARPGYEDREVRMEPGNSATTGTIELNIVMEPVSDTVLVDVSGTVKGPDREFFYHLIRKISLSHKNRQIISQKSRNKRAIRI